VSASKRSQPVFGRRNEPHTIIIAQGDSVCHFTVRPWLVGVASTIAVCFCLGYMMATSYLVFRDDLIGASIARQARMQHAYEDRISALRSQVDRIVSRQLLDQQLMEQKLAALMDRQNALLDRAGRIAPLLERAAGATENGALPVPTARPGSEQRASMGIDLMSTGGVAPAGTGYAEADRADRTFQDISLSLRAIEAEQVARLQTLVDDANSTSEQMLAALRSADIEIDISGVEASGGPFIPAPGIDGAFEATVAELDEALARLDLIRDSVSAVPLHNPAPGHSVSSTFGYRTDPLLGTRAFHSGIDFRGPTGSAVKASGDGVVTFAGANGGYGKMVELRHADGWTTRYAHLSAILVSQGERVSLGDRIGEIGSTGRSTGPHLHYEIRRSDKAHDPSPFLKAGKAIARLM
jgi:murein DD-endopeptidase MepM/ murein hydrolase activator NlpD